MMKKVNQSSLLKLWNHENTLSLWWSRHLLEEAALNCKTMKKHAGRCPQKNGKSTFSRGMCARSPFHTHLLMSHGQAEHRRISIPSYSSALQPSYCLQQNDIPSQLAKGKCNLQSLIPSSQSRATRVSLELRSHKLNWHSPPLGHSVTTNIHEHTFQPPHKYDSVSL